MENDFDGLLHEAYMPAAKQSRSRQRLRPQLPGRSELSTIGRDTLSTYVFNRSIKQIKNCLTLRGIHSPGTGSVYRAGSLLMCRTRLYNNCIVKLWVDCFKQQMTAQHSKSVTDVIDYLDALSRNEDPTQTQPQVFRYASRSQQKEFILAANYWNS